MTTAVGDHGVGEYGRLEQLKN